MNFFENLFNYKPEKIKPPSIYNNYPPLRFVNDTITITLNSYQRNLLINALSFFLMYESNKEPIINLLELINDGGDSYNERI